MKFLQSSKGLYTLAFLLIIITNIFILVGVSSNRSEITSSVVLTERELQMPYYSNEENSGVSLSIKWRVLDKNQKASNHYNKQASWLDKNKLEELGFNIQKITKQKNYKPSPKKEVLLVLEYDGKSYQKALKQVKQNLLDKEEKGKKREIKDAKKALHVEQNSASRLFVIDVDKNYNTLRNRYHDSSKYIIIKGIIKAYYNLNTKDLYGYIDNISVTSLHVELKYRQLLSKITKNKVLKYNSDAKPRYTVKVEYGSRYEPWINSVSLYK